MLTEVMEHFGLKRELHTAGFYETEGLLSRIDGVLAGVS